MDEASRRRYLQAMGIDIWVARDAPPPEPPAAVPLPVEDDSPVTQKHRTAGAEKPGAPAEAQAPPDWLDEIPPPASERAPEQAEDERAAPLQPGGLAGLGWDSLQARVSECHACALHASRQNTVFGVGDRQAQLMVIGEAPGAEEDRRGEPFVGRAGKLLDAMLLAIGLRREQVFIANILKCRPPDNRDPRPEEVLQCLPYLQRQVAIVQPKVILAVGRVAAQNLLQSHEAVGRMRGLEHRFEGIPVIVSYHPAYLLRSPDQKAKSWQDLQRAARLLRT